jgi:PD-(D/E)XK nuclease superfamily protein
MTPDQKGALAETAIVHAAVKLGIGVYKPVVEGGRCDLIFEVGERLVRVQCKWASRRGSIVTVRCHSSRRTRDGFIKRSYGAAEIDALVAYCPDLDRCFLLPPHLFAGRPYVRLRLSSPRNNQRRRVNWADAYAFEGYTDGFTGP